MKVNKYKPLENGIYKVKIRYIKKLRVCDENWFSQKNPFYGLEEDKNKNFQSEFFEEHEFLIKYDSEKNYVTEYKTGFEIPIVTYFTNSPKKEIECSNADNNKDYYCLALVLHKSRYAIPTVKLRKILVKLKAKVRNYYVLSESFLDGDSENLLNLPGEELDEIINEYNRIYYYSCFFRFYK